MSSEDLQKAERGNELLF